MRIGTGFDTHKHKSSSKLFVGTVEIEGPGFSGHSDGDIVVHALIDAMLGTVALGDIGDFFPSEDKKWKNASGKDLLLIIKECVYKAGLVIENIDIIVVSNIVIISLVRDEIITSLAKLLDISTSAISIKGKTREGYESLVDTEVSTAFATVLGDIK